MPKPADFKPRRATLDFILTVDGGTVHDASVQRIKAAVARAYETTAKKCGFTHRFSGQEVRVMTPRQYDVRLGFTRRRRR